MLPNYVGYLSTLKWLRSMQGENLVSHSEAYLGAVVCKSLEMSVEVLHQCEGLLPLADELKIVGKCVDAISSKACLEQIASNFSRLEYSSSGRLHMNKQVKGCGDWWIEDLSVLRIDIYQKFIEAMKSRGIRPESIGASVMNYTEKLLTKKAKVWNVIYHARNELVPGSVSCEDKIVVKTIASLLPVEKLVMPINFMFELEVSCGA